jgi:hypothetical protein
MSGYKQYANIITIQGYDDPKAEAYLAGNVSDEDMIEYLKQWDNGDTPVEYEDLPCGSADTVVTDGYYYLYSNKNCEYVGLVEKVIEE